MKTAKTESIPQARGTYILSLWCRKRSLVTVGRLGDCEFRRGYYHYIGSAFGPGGLRARIRHHLTPILRPHWHLDYVHAVMTVKSIRFCSIPEHLEHRWATRLSEREGVTTPVPGFGCSDCKCPSHFFYSPQRVNLDDFAEGGASSGSVSAT